MAARKVYRPATVETDDEDEHKQPQCKPVQNKEGVKHDEPENIQVNPEGVPEKSDITSHLMNERSLGERERLSSIPEGSNIQSDFVFDDEFKRLSLNNSLRDFSFPILKLNTENGLGISTSRTSSASVSSTSVPPSPATSFSSTASFSSPTENRRSRSESTAPKDSSLSIPKDYPPTSQPRSFTSGSSFPPPNISRRVSFKAASSKPIIHQNTNRMKSQEMGLFVEKALAARLPNKYAGSRNSLSRNKSYPTVDTSQQQTPTGRSSDGSLPRPPIGDHSNDSRRSSESEISPHGSPEKHSLPPKTEYASDRRRLSRSGKSSHRSPERSQRVSIGSRASSYASQTKHRNSSLQQNQPPELNRGPSDIPSKEQWRSSLKSSQASNSSRASSRASSIESDSSSLRHEKAARTLTSQTTPRATPRPTNSSPTQILQPTPRPAPRRTSSPSSPRQETSSPKSTTQTTPRPTPRQTRSTPVIISHSTPKPTSTRTLSPTPDAEPPSDSFTSMLPNIYLSNLLPHLDNITSSKLTHYATTWSYTQTLSQILYPDRFYLENHDTVHRSYLSPSVRSFIYSLAHTICRKDDETGVLPLIVFSLRFAMFFGTDVLSDAPAQSEDPTGLREVESTYQISKEVGVLLEGRGEV